MVKQMHTTYGFHPGMQTRVRSLDDESEVCVHSSSPIRKPIVNGLEHGSSIRMKKRQTSNNDFLMHYGIKGQKWGVITKEYEPVAIDHRKLRKSIKSKPNFASRVHSRINAERANDQAQVEAEKEYRKNKRERNTKKIKIAGATLGSSLLLISLLGNVKSSGVKIGETYKNGLHSLLKLKPHKGSIGKLLSQGFYALDAHEREKTQGLKRVGLYFKNAGNIITMRRYREKIKKARNFISQIGNKTNI